MLPLLPRRLISISSLVLLAVLNLALLFPLALLTVLVSIVTRFRSAHRVYAFFTIYLLCEVVGVLVAFGLWILKPLLPDYVQANRTLQLRWANALTRGGAWAFNVSFSTQDTSALDGSPGILFPRHNSLADTVLPMTFYSGTTGTPLRYVLKRELLWDPCLDIVGNRLPNYFIDRSGNESATEISNLGEFVSQLPTSEGLVFYPEGTRFSQKKREHVRSKASPELADRMDNYVDLLPPRLGGTIEVLQKSPGHDLIFCCHTGFGGAASLSSLATGAWTHAQVRMSFWRVPYSEYAQSSDLDTFIHEQWIRMQAELDKLKE